MIAAERQLKILDALTVQTFLSLPQLAEMMEVSVMTIRRDVAELSSRGQIIAVRGGVRTAANISGTVASMNRHPSLLRGALSQIEDRRIIFLDGGELCRELVQYIPWREDMTAVTNDFQIASYIIDHTPAILYFIGGELRRSDTTFHRRIALDTLQVLNFEILFLAPDFWNEKGAWHHEEHRQAWYQALIASSGKTVLLARSLSFGRPGLFHLYSLEKADAILTDHAESSHLLNTFATPSKLHILR